LLRAGPGRAGDGAADRPGLVPRLPAGLGPVGGGRRGRAGAGGRAGPPAAPAQEVRAGRLSTPTGCAVMRRLLLLVGGTLAFWLLASLPFRAFDDDRARGTAAVAYAGTAVLLCLVPAALTLAWGGRALQQSPEQQLIMVLGGTGVRLFTVLAAGW